MSEHGGAGGGGAEERTPEPKPRWNPKPEQIRILEAIFNSGMVNPPRDEIRRIRVQLQEYGQVGDANVFYWFQNRKSRSKHKQRQLQSRQHQQQQQTRPTSNVISVTTASSSSSSSDPSNSSGCSDKTLTSLSSKTTSITGTAGGGKMELSNNSPTASVNQTYFTPGELPLDQFFFHAHAHAQAQAQAQAQAHAQAQGYNCNISPADLSLSSLVAAEQQGNLGLRSGFWSELMMTQPQPAESGCKNISAVLDGDYHLVMDETKGKMHHHHQQQFHSNNIYGSPAPIATAPIITAASILQPPPSPTPQAPQPQPQPQPPPPPPAVTATTTTTTGATKDASLLLSAPISEMLQGMYVSIIIFFLKLWAVEVTGV